MMKQTSKIKRFAWVTSCITGWRVIIPIDNRRSGNMVHSAYPTKADAMAAARILRAYTGPRKTRAKKVAP